uniref:Zinc finger CCHC domain-containing protein 7 n=1 Tax=Neogobius melanostomus TaxID=47308 RepID=A0A8C6TZ62_9GOBI
MILDQVSQDGDSTIQLNLSYSNISSSEEEDTDSKDDDNTLLQDSWAVSKRDKEYGKVSICRYFVPGQSLICPICKKTGHRAKSCHMQRKYPICVLCGIQGHLQKECPTQTCSRCGLLAHGARACDRPPVWHQHCQRCGIMGHLLDICPDTWRQFHHTIKRTEVPIRRWTYQTMKRKKRRAHCYNCSKRGHYGHECHLKRMISGTFFTLPYVCHYDGTEKVHHSGSRTQNKNMEMTNKNLPLPEQPQCFKSFGEDKDQLVQKRNKMKQKAQASMRKTWPERRRERQEVKRLRREAQARREGGVLGQCRYDPDGDILDPFGVRNPWQQKKTFKKIAKTVLRNRRNKKNKDTEQWEKEKRRNMAYSILIKRWTQALKIFFL